MIYLFTWNSDFLLREQVNSWKQKFIEKNWDFNLLHLKGLSEIDNNFLVSNLTWSSFFSEKKLIIIDNFPLSAWEKSSEFKNKQDFLETLLDNIPEENIVLFNSLNPDKRSKFYKTLVKAWGLKEFSVSDDREIVNIISKKYWENISKKAIDLIIKYKAWNLTKIFSELDKLFIAYDFVDEKEIVENIVPELEESIFQFIDDLLNLNLKQALSKMNIILEQTNVYAFYNNLLANLRAQVFIEKLKADKVNPSSISDILWLWNRAFLVNKRYKISSKKLEELYIWFVDLDKKMKTWSMIASEDDVLVSEIERCILWLK